MRIKLPGSMRTKSILLGIFVVIAIGIFVYEGYNNKKEIETLQKNQEIQLAEKKKEKQIQDDIEKKQEKLEGMYNEAFATFHSKEYKNTIELSSKIIEEEKNYYKAYSLRGIATAYNGDLEAGMKDIDKALELKGDYGYGRFNKALAYELYGKYDDALVWYNKALEIEKYEWSYYGIASIYGRKGDVKNTVEYLKKAVDKNASVKEAAKTEADFNNVKNSDEFKELVK
ncbi:Tetratricopeptide repeat-containing protein [Clostridium cavendishii DSM 21758]|uniref:Tetratricopeptide repeat-containing protein n=1 Tax=Clostridium cavendishii DSM 21758 TaxID=1121302 RepID=A0A1M6M2E5_9CLOT|nr:Tetratricopeptide repeat-containing protein [Clostridium cavendishii DSM 21758]